MPGKNTQLANVTAMAGGNGTTWMPGHRPVQMLAPMGKGPPNPTSPRPAAQVAAPASTSHSLSSLLEGGEGQGEEGLAARKVHGVSGAGRVRAAPPPLHPQGSEEAAKQARTDGELSFTRLP